MTLSDRSKVQCTVNPQSENPSRIVSVVGHASHPLSCHDQSITVISSRRHGEIVTRQPSNGLQGLSKNRPEQVGPPSTVRVSVKSRNFASPSKGTRQRFLMRKVWSLSLTASLTGVVPSLVRSRELKRQQPSERCEAIVLKRISMAVESSFRLVRRVH